MDPVFIALTALGGAAVFVGLGWGLVRRARRSTVMGEPDGQPVIVNPTGGIVASESLSDLLVRGTPAMAALVGTFETGMKTPDGDDVVGLVLNVHEAGQQPFQVRVAQRMDRHQRARLVTGAVFPVRLDPGDVRSVAIDWERAGKGSGRTSR
ncbi:MAG: hypothetical protein ACT4PI_05610 [Actinomycetota bacterium]